MRKRQASKVKSQKNTSKSCWFTLPQWHKLEVAQLQQCVISSAVVLLEVLYCQRQFIMAFHFVWRQNCFLKHVKERCNARISRIKLQRPPTRMSCLCRFPDCGASHHCFTKVLLQDWQWLLQTGGPEDEMGWGSETMPGRRFRAGQYPEPYDPGFRHLADFHTQRASLDRPQQQCGKPAFKHFHQNYILSIKPF